MAWYKERVWQMGIGALLVLAGTVLAYAGGADDPPRPIIMWSGLLLIVLGITVPLLTKLIEHIREDEEGET